MQAIILAGGLGHRLKPFTEVIPKPLLPLGEKTIMELQIAALRRSGATRIYVATNYMSDLVEAYLGDGSRFGVEVRVSREEKPLGTCGPIGLLKNALHEPFLVMNGDILTKLDYAEMMRSAASLDACLTVATKVIVTPFRFGNVEVDPTGRRIVGVEEKPELRMEIVAGIYCLTPRVFEYIPENEYFGMDSLIKLLLKNNEIVGRYLIEDYWLDIGQVDDYSKARAEVQEAFDDV